VRLAGADDAGVAGDGVFDLGVALGDLVGDRLKQSLTMFNPFKPDFSVRHFSFQSPLKFSARASQK